MARKITDTSCGHVSDVRPEYLVLGLLAHRSMHGYDLYQLYLRHLADVWRMSQSQMYSILKRLETQGFVEGLIEERGGTPNRRHLVITRSGLMRFSAWLAHPTDCSARVLRVELIARIFFALMQEGNLAIILVQEQAASIARELANHERIRDAVPADSPFQKLSAEFRVRQLAAELDWIERCIRPLVAGEPGQQLAAAVAPVPCRR